MAQFDWFPPLSESMLPDKKSRYRAALTASGLTFLQVVPTAAVFAEPHHSIAPVFNKTILYQSFTTDPKFQLTPPDANFFIDKWLIPLSEPIRQKPRLQTGRQQFTALHPVPIVSFDWSHSMRHDPVRQRPRLQTGSQLAGVASPVPFVSYGWNWQHPDPVRFRPAIKAAQQLASAAFHPNPVVSFGWSEPLDDPKRFKAAIRPAQQRFTDLDPFPFTFQIAWFSPLSEPRRFRPALTASAQLFLTFDPFPLPPVPPPDCFHLYPSLEQGAGLAPGIATAGRLSTSTTLSGKLGGTITTSRTIRNRISKAASLKPTTDIC